jgi:hypothetical protein
MGAAASTNLSSSSSEWSRRRHATLGRNARSAMRLHTSPRLCSVVRMRSSVALGKPVARCRSFSSMALESCSACMTSSARSSARIDLTLPSHKGLSRFPYAEDARISDAAAMILSRIGAAVGFRVVKFQILSTCRASATPSAAPGFGVVSRRWGVPANGAEMGGKII